MSLEEEEIKKCFLKEGASEVGLQVKRHRLLCLGTFSFYLHNSNPIITIVKIIPIVQIMTLRHCQGKSFSQSSTARKQRRWDFLLKSMFSPASGGTAQMPLPNGVLLNSLRI